MGASRRSANVPDDFRPHDPRRSRSQIRWLIQLLEPKPRGGSTHILDLGCGDGRVLVELAKVGHRMIGVDRDSVGLVRCLAALERSRASADLIEADFTDPNLRFPRCDAVGIL